MAVVVVVAHMGVVAVVAVLELPVRQQGKTLAQMAVMERLRLFLEAVLHTLVAVVVGLHDCLRHHLAVLGVVVTEMLQATLAQEQLIQVAAVGAHLQQALIPAAQAAPVL